MIENARRLIREAPPDLRRRLMAISLFLAAFNGLTWLGVLLASRSYAPLLGLAALAYGFGLRHAVDPDHIAAIDNTTRKLMQEGKRPVATGFFFSMGHSTIVIVLSIVVGVSASFVRNNLPSFQANGSVIGTSVSAVFLLIIGLINLLVLIDIVRTWRRVVRGSTYDEEALTEHLENRGLIARLLKPALKSVSNSWHMYPIGLLFGLGFDTASEVGLLSISAATGASGAAFWNVVLLPLCFTAGMSLIDSLDGIGMLAAYGWAFIKPVRKLYYNMTITMISVMVALFIGAIEGLQIISRQTGASGGVWALAGSIRLENFGFFIIGTFALSWLVSMLVYKVRRYDRLDKATVSVRTP